MMDRAGFCILRVFFGRCSKKIAAVRRASLSARCEAFSCNPSAIILGGLFLSEHMEILDADGRRHTSVTRSAIRARACNGSFAVSEAQLMHHAVDWPVSALRESPSMVAWRLFKVSYPKFCAVNLMTALIYCTIISHLCTVSVSFSRRIEYIMSSLAANVDRTGAITFWRPSQSTKNLSALRGLADVEPRPVQSSFAGPPQRPSQRIIHGGIVWFFVA